MAKKVDGINRINKENLAESREIVLHSIEEEMKKREILDKENHKIFKKVDGIFRTKEKEVEKESEQEITPENKSKTEENKPVLVKKIIKPTASAENIKVDQKKKEIWQKEMSSILTDNTNTQEQELNQNKIKINQDRDTQKFEAERKKEDEKLKQRENERQQALKRQEAKERDEQEKQRIKEEKIAQKRAAQEKQAMTKQELIEKKKLEAQIKAQQKIEEAKRKEEEALRREEEKIRHQKEIIAKKESLKQEKIKLKQEKILARKKAKEEKRKEKIRLAKEKRETKLKLIAERKKARAKQRIINKKKREKFYQDFKIKFKASLKALLNAIIDAVRRIFVYAIIILAILIAFYVLLIFLISKLQLDNQFLRETSKILPVPAIFSKTNLIEYYQYQDLRTEEFLKSEKSKEAIDAYLKLNFVREMIWNDLADKYVITEKDELKRKAKILEQAAYDQDINQVPINRINSIMNGLKNKEDFTQAGKYGDEQGSVTIKKSNLNLYNFGEEIKDLPPKEISKIIVTPEGYYIFKGISNNSKQVEVSYVLVKTNDLNSYIEEQIPTYKIWSLID